MPEQVDFGTALNLLKRGYRMQRLGWNGKGMWVSMTNGRTLDLEKDNIWTPNVREAARANNGTITLQPYLSMKNAQNELIIGWTPSQSDMLSEDWIVFKE